MENQVKVFFAASEVKNLKNFVNRVIKKHTGLADETQTALMGIAYQMEAHGNCDQLTNLIKGLSFEKGEKVVLTANARQIGKYMQDHLPLNWDRETQTFKMKGEHKDFDWAKAAEEMAKVRWDKYGVKKADDEFNAEKEFGKVLSLLKKIARETDENNPFHRKAAAMARAAGAALEA